MDKNDNDLGAVVAPETIGYRTSYVTKILDEPKFEPWPVTYLHPPSVLGPLVGLALLTFLAGCMFTLLFMGVPRG